MKKELLYLLMVVFTGFTFVSCSSDDDDPDYAKDIAKTYSGSLNVELNMGEWVPAGEPVDGDITIERTAENVASLKLIDFKFNDIPIGTITVKNIAVTKSGDTYSLSGSDVLDLSLLQLGKGTVKVTGTVDKDKKCVLKYIEIELDTPMHIRVTFTSK